MFSGPDDAMSVETVRLARHGSALIVGPGSSWHSASHTDDVGPAVTAALSAPSGVYNVVDDEPLRRDDLLSLLASTAKRSRLRRPPGFIVPLAGAAARVQARSQRVSAARFHEVTVWNPTVPSRRHGWPAAFERIR
jgi:nucleoside-diphosphate-sugar epimerase